MLENRNYTKEELARLLGIMSVRDGKIRTDIIVRKLNNLNYRFSTSGRGDTYRIHIYGLPQTLETFTREKLHIHSNVDNLSHFLYLIFALDEANVNIPASSLQWKTHSCNDTLQRWLNILIENELLLVDDQETTYYATRKKTYKESEDNETGDYCYTREVKFISKKEYETAMRAYNYAMEDMRGIDENPELARGEVQYYAAVNKLRELDGWWAMKAKRIITINKKNPLYNELIELLTNYVYEEYEKKAKGNYVKEREEQNKREEQWKQEKMEKQARLAAAAEKAQLEQNQKEQEELMNRIKASELEENLDLIQPTEDIGEFLVSLYENYISKGE